MTTYAPTVNPGDIRTRTRYIGIRIGLDALPLIDVLEQEVIRTTTGERVLADLGALPVGQFDPSETFNLLDPETDLPVGGTATVGQAFAIVYSWVRAKQTARDVAAEAAAIAAAEAAAVEAAAVATP